MGAVGTAPQAHNNRQIGLYRYQDVTIQLCLEIHLCCACLYFYV